MPRGCGDAHLPRRRGHAGRSVSRRVPSVARAGAPRSAPNAEFEQRDLHRGAAKIFTRGARGAAAATTTTTKKKKKKKKKRRRAGGVRGLRSRRTTLFFLLLWRRGTRDAPRRPPSSESRPDRDSRERYGNGRLEKKTSFSRPPRGHRLRRAGVARRVVSRGRARRRRRRLRVRDVRRLRDDVVVRGARRAVARPLGRRALAGERHREAREERRARTRAGGAPTRGEVETMRDDARDARKKHCTQNAPKRLDGRKLKIDSRHSKSLASVASTRP